MIVFSKKLMSKFFFHINSNSVVWFISTFETPFSRSEVETDRRQLLLYIDRFVSLTYDYRNKCQERTHFRSRERVCLWETWSTSRRSAENRSTRTPSGGWVSSTCPAKLNKHSLLGRKWRLDYKPWFNLEPFNYCCFMDLKKFFFKMALQNFLFHG